MLEIWFGGLKFQEIQSILILQKWACHNASTEDVDDDEKRPKGTAMPLVPKSDTGTRMRLFEHAGRRDVSWVSRGSVAVEESLPKVKKDWEELKLRHQKQPELELLDRSREHKT